MAILDQEIRLGIDISTAVTVMTYSHPATAEPVIAIPRVDLGVPAGGPVTGGGTYTGYALIGGHQVTPQSAILFAAAQTTGVLQGRSVTLSPGDVLTIQVVGLVGDTAVNVTTTLFDSTPIQRADLEGLTGAGEIAVDHNYGGADNLTYVRNGIPIDNATVAVYLASDYNAGRRSNTYRKGTTVTTVTGAWRLPIMLDPGTYVIQFYKQGVYGPDVVQLAIS